VYRRLVRTEVRAALVAVLIARTAVNGGHRIVYPFLPEIARGLGVSLGTMGLLLALRSLTGLAAPLVPGISEHLGRRTLMVAACGSTAAGCLVLAGANGVVAAAAGLVLAGLAKPAFDIPMQGWFGARVPYERRGRVLGTTELTWALSLLLALPAGFLIAATSWRAPFLMVAALSAVGAVAVLQLMVGDRPPTRVRQQLRWTRDLRMILLVVVGFRIASELLFVVYGSWLEVDFGLSVAAIGVFTVIVVGGELVGEGAVAIFADRVGLKRSIMIGLVGSAVVYASLGAVGGTLWAAVLAVVAWFILFEITIVATIPFVTGLAGDARERALALVATVSVGAGGLAAVAGPQLFSLGGMALCGLVAAASAASAAVILSRVRPPALLGS
jgi:MFS transporter, DHA1 family, inner membrane transport protein